MKTAKEAGLETFPERMADFGFTTPDWIDLNDEYRDIYITGYCKAQENVAEELKRILAVSKEGWLEENIKTFIIELENKC